MGMSPRQEPTLRRHKNQSYAGPAGQHDPRLTIFASRFFLQDRNDDLHGQGAAGRSV